MQAVKYQWEKTDQDLWQRGAILLLLLQLLHQTQPI